MSTAICGCIAALLSAVAGYFTWKASKGQQAKKAEQAVTAAEKAEEAEKAEARQAIFGKEDEKVNQIVAKLLGCIALLAIMAGCYTARVEIKYVPADRKIVSCTNELGVACKMVPDVVFAEMTDQMIELKNLKHQLKVQEAQK